MSKKKSNQPKTKKKGLSEQVRTSADPDSYLKQKPVWRFSDFDWNGPWGECTCTARAVHLRAHIEQHLANLESMTWDEIQKAAGGKGDGKGNNNHHIARDKLKKEAIERLNERGILADSLFSLRLDQGTRLYGVRENNCLRIVFFDPYHKEHDKCAYQF